MSNTGESDWLCIDPLIGITLFHLSVMDEVQRLIVDALHLELEKSIGKFLLVSSAWHDFILHKVSPVHMYLANRQRKTSHVNLKMRIWGCQDLTCYCFKPWFDIDVMLEVQEYWEGLTTELFGLTVYFQDNFSEIELDIDHSVSAVQIRSIIELASKLGLSIYVHVGCFKTGQMLNAELPGMFRDSCNQVISCYQPQDYPESFYTSHFK